MPSTPLEDARWSHVKSPDPSRDWCISLPQPWAELTLRSIRWCEDRATAPPAELLNKTLYLHARGEALVQKRVDAAAKEDAERVFNQGFGDLATKLPRGVIVGRVKLVAAFAIGGFMPGRKVRADQKSQKRFLGDWRAYDGQILHRWGRHEKGRWLWVFEPVERVAEGDRFRAYAGVFDRVTALALEAERSLDKRGPSYRTAGRAGV